MLICLVTLLFPNFQATQMWFKMQHSKRLLFWRTLWGSLNLWINVPLLRSTATTNHHSVTPCLASGLRGNWKRGEIFFRLLQSSGVEGRGSGGPPTSAVMRLLWNESKGSHRFGSRVYNAASSKAAGASRAQLGVITLSWAWKTWLPCFLVNILKHNKTNHVAVFSVVHSTLYEPFC